MGIRGRAPEGKKSIHWRTEKIPCGESRNAWVAGDAIAVTVHTKLPSKACLKAYCGVLTECPGCAARIGVDGLWYLPVYLAPAGEERIIWFHRDQETTLAKLKHQDSVSVLRPKAKNEGLQICKRPKPELYHARSKVHEMPQCIAEALVTLWGYRDRLRPDQLLSGPLHEGSDNGMSLEEKPREIADKLALQTLLARGAIGAAGGEQPTALAKDSVDELNRRFVDAAKNGKHKPRV